MDDATNGGNQGAEAVVKVEQPATPGEKLAEALAGRIGSTHALATDAHALATDAKQAAGDAMDLAKEVRDRMATLAEEAANGGGAALMQEVVNFLHRLFPGHGAPGTPSEPPR